MLSHNLLAGPATGTNPYFKIRVVDAETGRGVPPVELKTTSQQRFYTDSAVVVAFLEQGLPGMANLRPGVADSGNPPGRGHPLPSASHIKKIQIASFAVQSSRVSAEFRT